MMADYNGWADQREEEREVLDQLATLPPGAPPDWWTQWEGFGKVGLKQDAKAREWTLV